MEREEVAALRQQMQQLLAEQLQLQADTWGQAMAEAKALADSQAREQTAALATANAQLANLAAEMTRGQQEQEEQERGPPRVPSPARGSPVFDWDRSGFPNVEPRAPAVRDLAPPPPPLPPTAQVPLLQEEQSVASTTTATGRLSRATASLRRAVVSLRGSAAAGNNVLSNRIDRVKIQSKNVKDAFKEVLKEDEQNAEMYLDDLDNALAAADDSLDEAALWADDIDKQKDLRKEAISSRPRVTYTQFTGEQTDWHRFCQDSKKVKQQFEGDQAQALTVVLSFCGQRIQSQIKKFLGKPNGLDEAMHHLDTFYGLSHLALPSLKEEIRRVKPALTLQEVPNVCTKLLSYLESMSMMTAKDDPVETTLVHEIFRKLFLSSTELRQLVPALKEDKMSLAFVLDFVKDRFVSFELLKRTILKTSPSNTAGAMGLGEHGDPPRLPLKKDKLKDKVKDKEKVKDKVKDKKRDAKCFYCETKNMECDHKLHSCPKVGPAQRGAITKLGRCTDCLAPKMDGHICNRTAFGSGHLKMVYCAICTCNILFCTDKAGHARHPLPEITTGCMAMTEDQLPTGDAGRDAGRDGQHLAFAATLTEVRRQGMEMLRGLDDATPGSVNKGGIGRPASLYTVMTLLNGEDRLRVNVLIDSGSESSYYCPAIEAMAVRSEPRNFRIETLAMSGARPQVHRGLQSSFIVEMAQGGGKLQIDLLRHDGLERRRMKLRPKLLTVGNDFAIKHNLINSGLVSNQDDCRFPDDKALIIAGGALMVIMGMDLYHLQPTLVDSFSDQHGRIDLWLCPMQDRLLVSGNRSWPAVDNELDDLLKDHTTNGLYCEVLRDGETEDKAPLTALLGASVATGLPVARVAELRPALRYLAEADLLAAPPKVDCAGDEAGAEEAEDPLEDPHLLQQARAATARTLLAAGLASPALHSRLEHFAYSDPQPEHRLQASCLTCKSCPVCMEGSSGESYYLKIATAGFRENCLRIPMAPATLDEDQIPVKYFYKIKYLMTPGAALPGLNLIESYSRHCSLRRALQNLPASTQLEFGDKLTAGLRKGYWTVVDGFNVLENLQKEQAKRNASWQAGGVNKSGQVGASTAECRDNVDSVDSVDSVATCRPSSTECTPSSVTHFLPCGLVLKEDQRANTKARLVLDPSRSVNTNLIQAPNLESPITSILRRLASLPVLAFADIGEAFWRMRLEEVSASDLCFLMDQDVKSGRLSATGATGTKLVCLRPARSVMGVSQSPAYLSIAKLQLADDLEGEDEVLAHHIRNFTYVDDVGSGLTTQELSQVEGIFTQDGRPCPDPTCCGKDLSPRSPDSMVQEASPADERRAARHMLKGPAGRSITHRLALRLGRLEAALRASDMPTRGITCSLEATVCKIYLNALVLHYARMFGQGKVPQEADMDNVPVAEGFKQVEPALHKWYKPWSAIGPARPSPPARRDDDPIIRILGPSGRNAPEVEANVLPPDQSTLLGYLWQPATDTISTCKLPYVNLLPARRGLRPLAGRLYTPEDVVALHKKMPKGLSKRNALSAAHNVYDPLNICPWASVQLKYCYRLAVVDSAPDADYNTPLSEVFVKLHLAPGVQALLYAKRHLAQHRSWRLPPCIDYAQVKAELPVLCDGAFGILSGSGAIAYLVQRYQFGGEDRAKVYLYGAATELSPLNKPHHQVQAELSAVDLAQKQAEKGPQVPRRGRGASAAAPRQRLQDRPYHLYQDGGVS